MPLSNSVLRRYTPPTCTLQIVAHSSPVSRWARRSVIKQLQFELRFDDPRLPEEQRVNIQGDRDQLEALHEAVTIYVQDLLNQSPDHLNAVSSPQATPSSDSVAFSSPQVLDWSTNNSQALSQKPQPLEPSDASAHLGSDVVPKEAIATPGREIFLKPGRGLSHDLFLGSLANQETEPVIHLSVLQLFDLATALDDYAADVVALPSPSSPKMVPTPPAWASIAALVLLAAGLMTLVVQLFNQSGSRQIASESATQGSSSNDQQQIAQPSPIPGVPTPPLSSPETLPSLPPVGELVPSPSPSPPLGTLPGTAPVIPGAPKVNAPQTAPVISGVPSANTPQTVPVAPIPQITPAPPILINPAPRQDWSFSVPGEATTPRTSGARSPSSPVAPPAAAILSPSPQITPANPELEAALSEATRRGAVTADELAKTPTAGSRDSATLQERLRGTQTQTQPPSTLTTPDKPEVTAFNNIPQVAEVREYFNQQWEPPSSLTQTLEYSIVLGVDGTIQRIEPLGQAARNYVDRTGMPLIGERFVSSNKNGQTPRIRVVLAPDGKVQTFLESSR